MKPLRKGYHDRLMHPGGSPTKMELSVDYALAPFDRKAREMDATWGIDRLPGLVSPELAAKYARTLASLNDAIGASDAERAADRAAACIRGMEAMDAEARAHGHAPPRSGVIVCDMGGWQYGILPDTALWRIAEAEHPGLRIYSLREVGLLIQAAEHAHPLIGGIKDEFPGATVTAVRATRSKLPEDAIPFGVENL